MKGYNFLFILLLFCFGLNAGVGFSNVIGWLPALQSLSEHTYVEAHQRVDYYFATRYPIFANLSIVLALGLLLLLYRRRRTGFFWVLGALLFLVANVTVAITLCVPVNHIIQSWAVDAPPANWQAIRHKILQYHYIRAVLDFIAFLLLIIAHTVTLPKRVIPKKVLRKAFHSGGYHSKYGAVDTI